MTWAEICDDKFLASLPYRIETDRWGYFVMSPPPRREHAELQGEIARLLGLLMQGGRAVPECPLETSEGVKAVDVAWVSRSRRASQLKQACYLIAPEICVEIESPSNSREELMERKRLCFEKGAQEFWLCDLSGRMTYFDPSGEIEKSKLCPAFPPAVSLD